MKIKLHTISRRKKEFIPVAVAFAFFLLALITFTVSSLSSKVQAERIVESLYTTQRAKDLEQMTRQGLPSMYGIRFGKDLTEQGLEALLPIGLPYTFLFREFSTPAERTYVKKVELSQIKKEKDTAVYRYEVQVEIYLEKGLEVLEPVVEESYTGTITLKKSHLIKWKMDGFTVS